MESIFRIQRHCQPSEHHDRSARIHPQPDNRSDDTENQNDDEDNQQYPEYSTGIVSPPLAVRPGRQRSQKQNDEQNQENETQHDTLLEKGSSTTGQWTTFLFILYFNILLLPSFQNNFLHTAWGSPITERLYDFSPPHLVWPEESPLTRKMTPGATAYGPPPHPTGSGVVYDVPPLR